MNLKTILYSLSFVCTTACVSPDKILSKKDADLAAVDTILAKQQQVLLGRELSKNATINADQESIQLKIDSLFIQNEFKIMLNRQFERVFTNGGYTKTETQNQVVYERKESENSGPLNLILSWDTQKSLKRLQYTEVRRNLLYQTENRVDVVFDAGLMQEYHLDGFQKIIGLERNEYKIFGKLKP